MATAIARRDWLGVPLLTVLAALVGAVVSVAPDLTVGLIASCLALVLAFRTPVLHLTLLLLLTLVVPFSVQNALSGGGGAGVFPSDVPLVTGLLRGAVVLLQRPLGRARLVAAGLMVAFLAGIVVQVLHGRAVGADISQAGGEARALLGFGTLLIALPIVADAEARARLLAAMLLVGAILGGWGIAQWVLDIEFGGTGDVGVREGINYTTAGRGQVQGGLYGFAVAILMASAFLVSAPPRSIRVRGALLAVVILNTVSLLLTYERTFWVAATVGLALIIIRADGMQRMKAIAWTVAAAAITAGALATLTPSISTAARERFLSLGQYASDDSLRYRIVESRHVAAQISERPIVGSGLAAQIFWGRPWSQIPERAYYYNHNGYLALAWKLGVPLAIVLLVLVAWSIAGRGPAGGDPSDRALLTGAQAGLLALALVNVTFPSFSSLAITSAIGALLAVSAAGKDPSSDRCSTRTV